METELVHSKQNNMTHDTEVRARQKIPTISPCFVCLCFISLFNGNIENKPSVEILGVFLLRSTAGLPPILPGVFPRMWSWRRNVTVILELGGERSGWRAPHPFLCLPPQPHPRCRGPVKTSWEKGLPWPLWRKGKVAALQTAGRYSEPQEALLDAAVWRPWL